MSEERTSAWDDQGRLQGGGGIGMALWVGQDFKQECRGHAVLDVCTVSTEPCQYPEQDGTVVLAVWPNAAEPERFRAPCEVTQLVRLT